MCPCRCEGRNPVEHVGIEAYLNQEPLAEEQRDTVLLTTLQGEKKQSISFIS